VDETAARALLQRLGTFLDPFGVCFSRRAQRTAATQYIEGLFNDSERKSMQAMHGHLSDPGSYQALQHFITDSPWEAARAWTQLRTQMPVRRGVLAIDDTGLPKQGRHSVGVKRQYCGALGKIGNCQVAVSSALITAGRPWPLAIDLYLPAEWLAEDDRRAAAGIPDTVVFREKWRIALAQVRVALKAGFVIDGVVADADYGSTAAFRTQLERLGLRYGVAIRGAVTLWTAEAQRAHAAAALADAIPADQWQPITWGQGTKGPLRGQFLALRVRPTRRRGERWLLCEQAPDGTDRKYYLLNLDADATLQDLVTLARSRWPIEQQYRELKDDLGFDHFEGRRYRGWTHHAVLVAVAYTFLQTERTRAPDVDVPTLPTVRLWVREIFGLLYVIHTPRLLAMLDSFRQNPPPLRR
jgi:SRSO17 transposase